MSARKRGRSGVASTIGGIVAGFEYDVWRRQPPPHELVRKAQPVRGVAADGTDLVIELPDAPAEADASSPAAGGAASNDTASNDAASHDGSTDAGDDARPPSPSIGRVTRTPGDTGRPPSGSRIPGQPVRLR